MDYFRNKNRLYFLGGVALAVGALVVVSRLWNRRELPAMVLVPARTPSTLIRFAKDQEYHQAIEELRSHVASELAAKNLSKGTISSIYKVVVQLIKTLYLTNLQRQRVERRKHLKDHRRYVEVSLKAMSDNDVLVETGTLEVIRDLHIDPTFFENESKRHIQIDNNFAYMNILYLENLKTQMVSKDKAAIPRDRFLDFLRYQIDMYSKVKYESYGGLPIEQFLLIKQTYFGDLASERFGIEEEDFMVRPELLMALDFKELIDEYQEKWKSEEDRLYYEESTNAEGWANS